MNALAAVLDRGWQRFRVAVGERCRLASCQLKGLLLPLARSLTRRRRAKARVCPLGGSGPWRRALCALLALAQAVFGLGLLGAVVPVQAVPIQWRSTGFEYVANGKPLKEVLSDFGASQGMAVAISSDVEGTVAGKFKLTPEQFLNLLALSYGFIWYYNGAVLHIASAKGIRSTLVKMTQAHVSQLREVLERMQVGESRFPIVYDEQANTALVSGPQEYVDLVRDMAAHLESRTEKFGRTQTRLFPLRYAWAADRTEGGTVQPGVVSTLRAIYAQGGASRLPGVASNLGGSGTVRSRKAATPLGETGQLGAGSWNPAGLLDAEEPAPNPFRPSGASAPAGGLLAGWLGTPGGAAATGAGTGPGAGVQALYASAPVSGGGGRNDGELGLPVIVADATNNSVIVRDFPERMAEHERLIRSLDERPPMIEIEVHILDIEDNAVRELGVDWVGHGNDINLLFGGSGTRGNVSYASGALPVPAAGSPLPAGVLAQAVVGNSARYLLAQVAAMENRGRAHVSAKPKVTTMNGVSAVMDSQQTFYVKVAGYQSAQLFDVSTGTALHVTPVATRGSQGYRIKLDVQVEDGQITGQQVDGLPVVSKNRITTQAFVNQGQSLLMAGYSSQVRVQNRGGVPGLSSIPLLGVLFRQDHDEAKRTDRLYLLTPRVIDSQALP